MPEPSCRLCVLLARVYLTETDWADWDRNEDPLFSRGGALFRLPADVVGDGGDFGEKARRLADFTDISFEQIVAPGSATPSSAA